AGPPAAFRLQGVEGRRLHRLRLLDLHGRLPAQRPQPGALPAARRTRWSWHAPGLGVRLAGESPHHVQPRLGRPGRPWSQRKRYVYWDAEQGKWAGADVPDFTSEKPPDYEPDWSQRPQGVDAHDGRAPFIMMADGKGWLFVPSGLKDGPLPTHYEPVESPVQNALYKQQDNPAAKKWERADNPYHAVGDPRYPFVLTTYRLTEHHSGAIPTRMVPSTAELQPEGFAEIPPELADELGIRNLD